MQCYTCGAEIVGHTRVCPLCGHTKSKLIYVHLCGVIGGIVGSWIGFTVYNLAAALAGGLLGILAAEFGASMVFRARAK